MEGWVGLVIIIIIIIIIITNEKIKVMLSRKRCRGTLQNYKKGPIATLYPHVDRRSGIDQGKSASQRPTS